MDEIQENYPECENEKVERPINLRLKHLLYFGLVHGGTIVALAFWIGVAHNRLAANEQRCLDNANSIHIIEQNGTPASRQFQEDVKDQLRQINDRLRDIQRTVK